MGSGEVGVGDAFARAAVIPITAVACLFQDAEAFRAEAQVSGEHFLFPVVQAVLRNGKGFGAVLVQKRLIWLRLPADGDLLPAFLRPFFAGTITAVNVRA